MKLGFALLITIIFISFSCLTQKPKFKNISYNLESVFVKGQKNRLVKDKATLQFETKTNSARCSLSCNFIELNYNAKKNKLNLTSIVIGPTPCPDRLAGLESDIKENFSKTDTYLLKNKRIYFFNKKDTLLIFYGQ